MLVVGQIFIMTSPSWSGEGQSASMNRPYAERMIADLPEIAIGGEFGSFGSSYRSYNLQPEGEHGSAENGFPRNMNTNIVLATKATIEIFGYEFLQGSWTDIEGDDHRLAISKSLAKKIRLASWRHYSREYKFRQAHMRNSSYF